MTSIYDALETDRDLETNGSTLDMGDLGTFKVAAWLNSKHQAALERLRKPYKTFTLSGRDIPADVNERIGVEAMAEAVLVGWSGVKDRDGSDLAYSVETAARLLTDLKTLRGLIVAHATEAANYRRAAVEAALGN